MGNAPWFDLPFRGRVIGYSYKAEPDPAGRSALGRERFA